MKRFKLFFIVLLLTISFLAKSQCAITASAYPNEICKGEPVILTASGACGYLMLNDFNNGTIGLGWYSNASPMFNNPCPPLIPPASGIVCWIGSAASYPRELTTIAYNLSIGSGYTIDWDMKYGDIQTHPNCEDPDLPNEGVHLQYSTNGPLGPWTDINYWQPTTNISGPLYTWNHYTENVPVIAWTPNTQFRWYQSVNSTNQWDHWGIDNVEIKATSGLYANVLWSTGDTTFSTIVYPNQTGQYWVKIDDSVYVASDTVYVTVHENPTPDFTVTSPICSTYDTAIINYVGNAPTSADYYWQASHGLQIPNGPGPHILTGLFPGTYVIMLNVNNYNCPSDLDTNILEVLPTPMIGFTADVLKGCEPLTVHFTNGTQPNNCTFTWNLGDGTITNDTNPFHTYWFNGDTTMDITLNVISDSGCENEYVVHNLIKVYPLPKANFSANPDSVSFLTPLISFIDSSSNYVTTWNWLFGDSGTSNLQNPEYNYIFPGIYTVQLKVLTDFGCWDTISKIVKIVEVMEDSLIFPNVFTPNNDGYNDFFVIDKLEDKHYINRQLIVFNRWGKKIYEKFGYMNEWDGDGVSDGTYFFIFNYTYYFNQVRIDKEVSGSITIIR